MGRVSSSLLYEREISRREDSEIGRLHDRPMPTHKLTHRPESEGFIGVSYFFSPVNLLSFTLAVGAGPRVPGAVLPVVGKGNTT